MTNNTKDKESIDPLNPNYMAKISRSQYNLMI
jgi:hypothetical protein